jgi:hypothetical protein
VRKLIGLLLAALVLHGTWRVGTAYWHRFQLEDEVRRLVEVSDRAPKAELRAHIMAAARGMGIAIGEEDLEIREDTGEVRVTATYVERVQILPRYEHPWPFTVVVRSWAVAAPPPRR